MGVCVYVCMLSHVRLFVPEQWRIGVCMCMCVCLCVCVCVCACSKVCNSVPEQWFMGDCVCMHMLSRV